MNNIVEALQQQVNAAADARAPLRIRGGGSKDWYGQALIGDICDTRPYAGIVDYEPTELVITARCGTPLREIEAALARQHQMLAFEPPHFSDACTIGGVVASGLAGPRRASTGAVRDFLLGAVLLDGRGRVLTFGGQVMKNVAGYDVSRMLAGSLGTLGLILEVSLKVLPLPFAEATLCFDMDQALALRRMNEWAGKPLPITASVWVDGGLTLRLSGATAAVGSARASLGGELVSPVDAQAFWRAVREQTHDFFSVESKTPGHACGLWRLSLPSVAAPLSIGSHGTMQLIEWGGVQRWLKFDADTPDPALIRSTAATLGGHASLFRGGDKTVGVFHPLAPALDRIHRNLKAAFDPAEIFNPGRMYQHF